MSDDKKKELLAGIKEDAKVIDLAIVEDSAEEAVRFVFKGIRRLAPLAPFWMRWFIGPASKFLEKKAMQIVDKIDGKKD